MFVHVCVFACYWVILLSLSNGSHTMSMDYTKPLTVPAGSDALGQIGMHSGT